MGVGEQEKGGILQYEVKMKEEELDIEGFSSYVPYISLGKFQFLV